MQLKMAGWMIAMMLMLPVGLMGEDLGTQTTERDGLLKMRPSAPTVPEEKSDVFRARGNEPFWSLEMNEKQISIKLMDEEEPIVLAKPAPKQKDGFTTYTVKNDAASLVLTIQDKVCADTMSGMPFPKTVTVELNGKTLRGCGGAPVELLIGKEWTVEEMGGKALVPKSKVTILFTSDGNRISGGASVNRYFGSFQLTGEGITLSPMGSTMMAGPEDLMTQESAFVAMMGKVTRFEISDDGALLLHTANDGTIKARR